jgi:hypothetical protein
MNLKEVLKKSRDFLLARPLAGGLEINDTSIRFVNAENSVLKTASVRLVPGTMNEGRIEDKQELIAALRSLRSEILGSKSKRAAPINVVVSLSSVNVYTQVFSLPFIEGDNLEKAIQLNIQMASPTGAAESYAGWQTVRSQDEHNMHLEVVTAFLHKGVADELTAALNAGGFLPIALESRALSFARLIKERAAGIDASRSLIAISADASGMDVMIVRAGHLHFDYFNSWKNLQGGEREISLDLFRTLVVRGLNQVMNFYNSHWKDPVSEILVSSTGLKEEILAAIRENFDIKVSELTPLVSPPVTPEWFVALGGALRSLLPRREDLEISLLGVSAQEEFQREQIYSFLGFWRVLTPAALAVLFAAFMAGYFFLDNFHKSLDAQATAALRTPVSAELISLRSQALRFNESMETIGYINKNQERKSKVLAILLEITSRRSIEIGKLDIGQSSAQVLLQGTAPSEDDIVALKNELVITPGFREVELPLTAIKQQGTVYSFSITFQAAP